MRVRRVLAAAAALPLALAAAECAPESDDSNTAAEASESASADACAPGAFIAPHGITADSRGDLYVGEVTWTYGVRNGYVAEGCHTLQKFARV